MSTAIRSDLLALVPTSPGTGPAVRPSALERVLADQQTLTAVERFARAHDADALPANAKFYRNLIPLTKPGPGQQYAFEVDLDACTGCKACVTGCHNLNGLDDGEVWRTVGLLHGGTTAAPAQQTITTACHHCLEPACLEGCPVNAYEKDPVTGIVKHLDDQCIGCQYCVLMCPYDAPKFSKQRGIVRKCDMCSDRLAHGEAPACVQSCPNQAIRISVVDRAEAVQAAEANAFLPGAPGPADTLPTTVYKTARSLPRNMLPADYYSVSPEHGHPPLVVMLGLTQLSVGAFVVNLLAHLIIMAGGAGGAALRALDVRNAICSLAFGMVALGASTLHLGRPQFAFRAFLGLRTSWLSREIIAFSLFAGLSAVFAASFFFSLSPALARMRPALGATAAGAGALGVFCSVMVYAATRRAHWRGAVTGLKFTLTALVLGAAAVSAISLASSAARASGAPPPFIATGAYKAVTILLVVSAGLKLGFEASLFRHLRDQRHSVEKRLALLMKGELGRLSKARFLCGVLGGIGLPGIGLALLTLAARAGTPPPLGALTVLAAAALALSLAGELCERYLFFAAAPASRMPGGVG